MSASVYDEFGYGYVTADAAPFEFELKSTPEDFLVEELPLYPATGAGDHVLIEVEKRQLTTLQAISRLAKALDRSPRDFGYAGLKDKEALTRQRFSLEHIEPERVQALDLDGLTIRSVERHASKLRLGHLAGNRFQLLLRGLAATEFERLEACLDQIQRAGLPNWFGEQRFGKHANGHRLGRQLLAGDWLEYLVQSVATAGLGESAERTREWLVERTSESLYELARSADRDLGAALRRYATSGTLARAVRAVPRPVRSLQLSALQSFLFNGLLAQRLQKGEPWRLATGDVAFIHSKAACFVVAGTEADLDERLAAFEISPAGPLFGSRLLRAEGEVDAAESAILERSELSHEAFSSSEAQLRGARRPYRVPLRDVQCESSEFGARISFTLPKGSYATSLVEELRKRHSKGDSGRESGRSGSTGPESVSR